MIIVIIILQNNITFLSIYFLILFIFINTNAYKLKIVKCFDHIFEFIKELNFQLIQISFYSIDLIRP